MSYTYNSIGFIGLGAMGFPMVENLIKKLHYSSTNLYVFDVSKEALERIAKGNEGRVHICADSREVADKAEIVLTMVPEGSHVRSVYLIPEIGVLAADLSSKLLIDCSTIDTETSLKVRTQVLGAYPTASFYDAPVSGGVLGAQKASLTIMLGCKEDDPNLGILKDLLGMMGSSIFPCGGPSLGLTAKLCNNYCSGLISIATAEAFNIGMRSGMDPRVLANIFSTSTAQSCVGSKWNPVPGICPEAPASHGYKNGFKVQLMKKDFGLAVEAAERVGAKLMLGEAGLATYAQASEDPRCKDLDSRVIYRFIGGNEEWESSLGSSEKK